jgi:hypothetical protein
MLVWPKEPSRQLALSCFGPTPRFEIADAPRAEPGQKTLPLKGGVMWTRLWGMC